MLLRVLSSVSTICLLIGCSGSSSKDKTTATHDSYDFASAGLVSIVSEEGVLANDKGVELKATLLVGPVFNEGFVFNADGSFSYSAISDEIRVDQFEYQIIGKDEIVQNALATITIYPKPVAVLDEYRAYVGLENNVTDEEGVLANDQLNRVASKAVLVQEPGQADSFVFNSDGSFSYTRT